MLMRCVADSTGMTMVPMTAEEEAATLAEWATASIPVQKLATLDDVITALKAKGILTDADLGNLEG